MLAAEVSLGSWFKLAETVLASFAKFIDACWTADADGALDVDDEPGAAFAPLVFVEEDVDALADAFAPFDVEDVDPFAVMDELEAAFVSPEVGVVDPGELGEAFDEAFPPLPFKVKAVDLFELEDAASVFPSDTFAVAPLAFVDCPDGSDVASLFGDFNASSDVPLFELAMSLWST